MTTTHENALNPASLATDGKQGEGAASNAHHNGNDTAAAMQALVRAHDAMEYARRCLHVHAHATDAPALGAVEAADLLDAACAALDGAA